MKHKTVTVRDVVYLHMKEYRKEYNLSESNLLQKVLDERTELREWATKIITPKPAQTASRYTI